VSKKEEIEIMLVAVLLLIESSAMFPVTSAFLELSLNSLSGFIPASIGKLTRLGEFDLRARAAVLS
jgi:hypothetical protein